MPSYPRTYCTELVRQNAHDWYLCAIAAPAALQDPRMVLAAYELEIRGISSKVGEEMVGFIRYAWWREAVSGLYAGKAVKGHQVLEPLAAVISSHNLPLNLLIALVEAHEQAMAEKSIPATSGILLQLYAFVAGESPTEQQLLLGQAWDAMQDCLHHGGKEKIAHTKHLLQQAGETSASTAPFAWAIDFYLKRMAKGNYHHSRVRLPFLLWCRA